MALLAPAAVLGASAAEERLAALDLAAAQGDTVALTQLAIKYENAEGVPKNLQMAHQLYCRAARQGHAEAQFRLAWIYANGRGVSRDDGIAAAMFSLAADQGHEYAARLLRYVRPAPDTQLPSCLMPDPPVEVEIAPINSEDPTVAETGSSPSTGRRGEIEALVHRLAPQYAIDPQLALAVILVESAFNPAAISPKNAQGLMQLIPETARRFGVNQIFNPAENVKGGLAYLRWLMAFFQGDVPLVIAAYNAGERAVEKYRGIPPYAETRKYVSKITAIYKKIRHPYESQIVEPSPVVRNKQRSRD